MESHPFLVKMICFENQPSPPSLCSNSFSLLRGLGRGSLSPTFTAPRVVNKVIVQSPAVAQLVPAFVVVSCSVGSAYWVLIGGAVVKTHAACFMCTVCLADPERWAVDIKTRIQVWKTKQKNILRDWTTYHNTWRTSGLCCAPLQWSNILLSANCKSLSYRFFLLPAAILQPLLPTIETSFPWCTAVDSVDYRSFLPCLI